MNFNGQMGSFQMMGQQGQPNPYYGAQKQYYPQMGQPQNGINWVQGIEGAKAYSLPPNSNVQLLDSENDGIFYIKISDNIGMCQLRIFKYEEITEKQNKRFEGDLSEYVRKDELGDMLNALIGGVRREQSVQTTESE